MKRKTVSKHILIGKRAEITSSNNKTLIGLNGLIVDETRCTFTLSTEKGDKRIIKSHVTLKIEGELIDGKSLSGRPEERIKNDKNKKSRS